MCPFTSCEHNTLRNWGIFRLIFAEFPTKTHKDKITAWEKGQKSVYLYLQCKDVATEPKTKPLS